MTYIEFKNVKKDYHVGDIVINAVNNCDFTIDEGEFVVVLGPSGAGKTTILNLLGGMDSATSGSIFVAGEDITRLSKKELVKYRRESIGFVFQFYNLIENLSAKENVEIAVQLSKSALDANHILEQVGLENRLNNFPSQLSGGEQQRVSIARAIAKNPKLLLCDEPTGALDSNTGQRIIELLQKNCRESGITTIIITHNAAIAEVADKVIRVHNGTISEVSINTNPKAVSEIAW
ncbi:ABC transporter ATP-binding protein [Erysipelothrix sp. HDW6A]|uniref:ABC transporter ATP-binding protein n=1 Tax=Erysipelothrix sp. HDW6A TaxID=2714928 RepID=UPI00140E89BF|nr:ABC transporter ATP-binding protein [Erysipelothrix sp. HDW6A]QIK56399.1 ABC transporter ATP-binding protein [Erysipelothrix sp. HDW6A]